MVMDIGPFPSGCKYVYIVSCSDDKTPRNLYISHNVACTRAFELAKEKGKLHNVFCYEETHDHHQLRLASIYTMNDAMDDLFFSVI